MAQETELDSQSPRAARLEVNRVDLTAVEGPAQGLAFQSARERVSVGTHASNDCVIDDPTVSRFHCDITVEEGVVTVKDLGSRNGTAVDGVPIKEAYLRNGSLLALGKTVLQCNFGEETTRVQLFEGERFGSLVGRSVPARSVFATLEKAALSDATVLLGGETGTGKEEAARSIHEASGRANAPFVVVDCGTLSPSLVESELFGHVRGAFTGASEHRDGAFVAANGGTVFLDEIGELSRELQPKLLRAIEDRTIQPVGVTKRQPVDVRLVAATRRDLRTEVNEGRFRSDLYFRLAVIRVDLPPLRNRPEDIPLLARRLLERLEVSDEARERLLQPEVLARLQQHAWPGNVRELRNHLEVAALLGSDMVSGSPTEAATLEAALDPHLTYGQARSIALSAFERQYFSLMLDHHGGNVSALARAAELNRSYLYELLRKHGLRGK